MTKSKGLRSIAAALAVIVGLGVFAGTTSTADAAPAGRGEFSIIPDSLRPTVDRAVARATFDPIGNFLGQPYCKPAAELIAQGFTPCLWGSEHFYGASAYFCAAAGPIVARVDGFTFHSIRACQDYYLITYTTIPVGLKYWYTIDLYKYQRYTEEWAGLASYLFGLYAEVFRFYGTQLGVLICDGLTEPIPYPLNIPARGACGYAWSWVREIG